jgi:hypothetical protein
MKQLHRPQVKESLEPLSHAKDDTCTEAVRPLRVEQGSSHIPRESGMRRYGSPANLDMSVKWELVSLIMPPFDGLTRGNTRINPQLSSSLFYNYNEIANK